MKTLCTIGYEGAAVADLIATLRAAKISVLIDIRDVPVSRKAGFSKRVLAEHLHAANIDYVHLKELGDPKDGRDAARRGDMQEFKKIFAKHMARKTAKSALTEAAQLAANGTACLFCYERSQQQCHRSIVAKMIADEYDFDIRHLGIQFHLSSPRKRNGDIESRESAVG